MPRGLLAVLATASVALLAPACGDDPPPWEEAADERATRVRQVALDAGLDEKVAEVMTTLARTVEATYRVTYVAVDASGTSSTVTVTQQPPNRRIDVVAPERADLTTVVTADESFTCVAVEGEWRCAAGEAPPEIGGLVETDAVAATEALAGSADEFALEATTQPVAGVEARCLVATPTARESAGADRLCVAPDGPPLLVERASGTLTATAYTTEVDPDAFELPAEPGAPAD